MTVCTKIYDAPPVNKREILRYLGVNGSTVVLEKLIDECLSEISDITYKVCYGEFPVAHGDTVDLGFMKTASETVKKGLSGCDTAVVFAATIGISIDRRIAKYSAVSPAKSLIFHAIGTERIESLCDIFCEDMSNGRTVCPRFSAGYGDFPLEAQKNIFAVLDCPRRIGVTLNESLLMSPTKSVTAIIGVKNENT